MRIAVAHIALHILKNCPIIGKSVYANSFHSKFMQDCKIYIEIIIILKRTLTQSIKLEYTIETSFLISLLLRSNVVHKYGYLVEVFRNIVRCSTKLFFPVDAFSWHIAEAAPCQILLLVLYWIVVGHCSDRLVLFFSNVNGKLRFHTRCWPFLRAKVQLNL
jgi:hypothetical protein